MRKLSVDQVNSLPAGKYFQKIISGITVSLDSD